MVEVPSAMKDPRQPINMSCEVSTEMISNCPTPIPEIAMLFAMPTCRGYHLVSITPMGVIDNCGAADRKYHTVQQQCVGPGSG